MFIRQALAALLSLDQPGSSMSCSAKGKNKEPVHENDDFEPSGGSLGGDVIQKPRFPVSVKVSAVMIHYHALYVNFLKKSPKSPNNPIRLKIKHSSNILRPCKVVASRMCTSFLFFIFWTLTSSSELPDDCQVNDPDKYDDMLASNYADLCNLWCVFFFFVFFFVAFVNIYSYLCSLKFRSGTFLSWNSSVGDGYVWFSSWGEQTPCLDVELVPAI